MNHTQQDRITRYLALASIPAGAAAGHATADIIHYGGPAIQISRAIVSSGTSGSVQFQYSFGSASILNGDSSGPMMGLNIGMNVDIAGSGGSSIHYGARAAKVKMNRDAGSSWAIATMGYGLAKQFGQSSVVGGSFTKLNPTFAKLAMSVSSSFNSASSSSNSFTQIGAWATQDGEASRGYLGFAQFNDETGEIGYGWMDIGWDGEIITIYDWAFNEDGSIHVGAISSVPAGSGLAALAMGAAGLRRRRKRSA